MPSLYKVHWLNLSTALSVIVMIDKADSIRAVDNDFSISQRLVKKLPEKYRVQQRYIYIVIVRYFISVSVLLSYCYASRRSRTRDTVKLTVCVCVCVCVCIPAVTAQWLQCDEN